MPRDTQQKSKMATAIFGSATTKTKTKQEARADPAPVNVLSTRVGDTADIHLTAYPDRVLTGRISNIGAILDPAIRTAKIRIEVANPGLLRIGMFVTAIFRGQTKQTRAVVPSSAILHLHDREWVYVPAAPGRFQRVEVTSGHTLPGGTKGDTMTAGTRTP